MKHVTQVRLGLTRRQRNAAPVVSAVQARTYADAKATPTEVSSILEQRIRGVQEESNLAETGRVLSVGYVFSVTILGSREGERQESSSSRVDAVSRKKLSKHITTRRQQQ